MRVKLLVTSRNFGANLDTFVVNQFVCGITNRLFKKLCEVDEKLTIAGAFKKASIAETKIKAKELSNSQNEVNLIKSRFRDKFNNTMTEPRN